MAALVLRSVSWLSDAEGRWCSPLLWLSCCADRVKARSRTPGPLVVQNKPLCFMTNVLHSQGMWCRASIDASTAFTASAVQAGPACNSLGALCLSPKEVPITASTVVLVVTTMYDKGVPHDSPILAQLAAQALGNAFVTKALKKHMAQNAPGAKQKQCIHCHSHAISRDSVHWCKPRLNMVTPPILQEDATHITLPKPKPLPPTKHLLPL